MPVTDKQLEKLRNLKKSLEGLRSVFEGQWGDIIKYLSPSYASVTIGKPDEQPAPNYKDITETTGVDSSNTMADGLQGYAFGRNISWFRLQFEVAKLLDNKSFKEWLQSSEKKMYKQLNNSNFYDESRTFIKCCSDFGTAVMTLKNDNTRSVPVFSTLHPGTYCIQENQHGVVDTLFRDFWMSKEEAIEEFGEENLPDVIVDSQDPAAMYEFHHYIGPNWRVKLDVPGEDEFVSVYWSEDDQKRAAKEERFERKTFFAWRWAKNPGKSPWGVDAPGLTQIANIKMLQSLHTDQGRVSQLQGRPLIKKTAGLKINFYPSGMTDLNPGEDFQIQQTVGDLSWTQVIKQEIKQQVKSAYYVDFFLAIMQSQQTNKNKTATEVAGLQDEKAAIMSAFTSRLAHEFIEPVLEAVYQEELKMGRLESIPQGMENENLNIDFVSPLAMMQKRAHGLGTTKQFITEILAIAELAQIIPSAATVFDVIDIDKYVTIIGESFDVDDRIIKTDEEVKKIREERLKLQLQQMQQEQQMQQAQLSADVMAKGSKAPEKGSPVERSMNQK